MSFPKPDLPNVPETPKGLSPTFRRYEKRAPNSSPSSPIPEKASIPITPEPKQIPRSPVKSPGSRGNQGRKLSRPKQSRNMTIALGLFFASLLATIVLYINSR